MTNASWLEEGTYTLTVSECDYSRRDTKEHGKYTHTRDTRRTREARLAPKISLALRVSRFFPLSSIAEIGDYAQSTKVPPQ